MDLPLHPTSSPTVPAQDSPTALVPTAAPTKAPTTAADGSGPPLRVPLAERCCATAALALPRALPEAQPGSRRRRLWELGSHAHCPVIGVCLPLPVLRRLAAKALGGQPLADDYTLHSGTVHDCQLRSPLAEAVQRELDRRYALPLRHAAALKDTEALALWWQAEAAAQRLPGALWATLTHPRCSADLARTVLGQVHMLQHQVGMAGRLDQARLDTLLAENAVLAQALAAAQRRSSQLAAEQAAQQQALQAEMVRLRGRLMAAHSAQALARDELAQLRAQQPDLPSREALQQRLQQQRHQLDELQRQLRLARDEARRLREHRAASTAPTATATVTTCAAPATPAPGYPMRSPNRPDTRSIDSEDPVPTDSTAAGTLAQQAVLCVGGRTASVPVYRRLVERLGARFLHHDGGSEHADTLLDTTLAAADLVICQAGCVSHNAYWRVKDHCKRTGKRCVYVDSPSASSLQRALARMQTPAHTAPDDR